MTVDPLVNGHFRNEEEDERLRIVIFVSSIVSDWENPSATSSRALAREFRGLGHEVRVLEQRLNAPTSGYIRNQRADPAALLHATFPEIEYFTFDPPIERESMVWLGREATGADAVIVRADAPEFVRDGMRRLQAPFLASILENETDDDRGLVQIQPALRAEPSVETDRSNQMLLVAYDDTRLALDTAPQFPGARLIVSGSADLPEWEFVPELELPQAYERASVALVVDAPNRPPDLSRCLLGMASGCHGGDCRPRSIRPWIWLSERCGRRSGGGGQGCARESERIRTVDVAGFD